MFHTKRNKPNERNNKTPNKTNIIRNTKHIKTKCPTRRSRRNNKKKIQQQWKHTNRRHSGKHIQKNSRKNPTQTALICGEETLTYSELDQKSTNLAKFLINNKLPKGKPIVLFFDKSLNMIISILAVLKSRIMLCTNITKRKHKQNRIHIKRLQPILHSNRQHTQRNTKNINSTIFTVDTIEKHQKSTRHIKHFARISRIYNIHIRLNRKPKRNNGKTHKHSKPNKINRKKTTH